MFWGPISVQLYLLAEDEASEGPSEEHGPLMLNDMQWVFCVLYRGIEQFQAGTTFIQSLHLFR